MPLPRRLKKNFSHKVDIKGIAVALAFLLIVSVLAGGRDTRTVSENQPPPSASLPVAPTLTMEKAETLQDDASQLFETSSTLTLR